MHDWMFCVLVSGNCLKLWIMGNNKKNDGRNVRFFFFCSVFIEVFGCGVFFVLLWLVGLFWWPYMFQILRDCHMQGQDFDSVVLVAPF